MKLTSKQYETLKAISEFTNLQGRGPNVKELRIKLNLGSEQAVDSRLKKLLNNRYIYSVGTPRIFFINSSLIPEFYIKYRRFKPSNKFKEIFKPHNLNKFYLQYQEVIDQILLPDFFNQEISEFLKYYIPIKDPSSKSLHNDSNNLQKSSNQEIHVNKYINDKRSMTSYEVDFLRQIIFGKNLIVYRGNSGKGKSSFIRKFFDHTIGSCDHIDAFMIDCKQYLSFQYAFDFNRFVNLLYPLLESRILKLFRSLKLDINDICQYVLNQRGFDIDELESKPNSYESLRSWVNELWPNDLLRYSTLLLQYYRKINPSNIIFLIFDNLDQYPVQTQIEMLRFSITFSIESNCKIILAMRETTYSSLKKIMKKDGYYQTFADGANLFSIIDHPPTDFHEIIRRRNKLILKELPKYISLYANNKTIKIKAIKFLRSIRNTLEEKEITNLIIHFSGNNIRLALLTTLKFFQSSYIDREKMSQYLINYTMNIPQKNMFSQDEFLKCIILYNRHYYIENDSDKIIINLFGHSNSNTEYPTLIRLLTIKSIYFLEGIRKAQDVIDFVAKFGFARNEILNVLEKFKVTNLIDVYPSINEENRYSYKFEDCEIEINSRGEYYLNKLIFKLEYVQHMADDIYYSEDLINKYDINSATNFSSRLNNVKLIIEQIQRDEVKIRINTLLNNPDSYKLLLKMCGDELLSIRIINSILEKNVIWQVSSEFGKKHNLENWVQQFISLKDDIKKRNNDITLLTDNINFSDLKVYEDGLDLTLA